MPRFAALDFCTSAQVYGASMAITEQDPTTDPRLKIGEVVRR
jgi:hypothetical protein